MAFDGITLNSIVNELQILVGGKVNHIYQPQNNNVLLSIYKGNLYGLNIDTSASDYRLHLTTHSKPNPLNAPNFCMLLRKYLIGSKITSIYMIGLERICYIDFECFNEMNDRITRTLVIELMGKYSNIILLNENKIIIDALKKFDGNGISRDIMPARKYTVPSSSKEDFTKTSINEFIKTVKKSDYKTLDIAISNLYTGLSKMLIQSLLDYFQISNTISDSSLKEIYSYLQSLINHNKNSAIVCHSFKNNYTINIESAIQPSNNLLSVNFYLDDYYFDKSEKDDYIAYKNNLLKVLSYTLDKITNKMNNINEKINTCNDLNKYKIYGELLIANMYKLQNSHIMRNFNNNSKISNSSNFFCDTSVILQNYYDNNLPVEIPVSSSISISQNAQKYFKKYNKLKNTLEITKIQKEETAKELNYLESLIYELDNCSTISDVEDIYDEISESILFNDSSKKIRNNHKSATFGSEQYLSSNKKNNLESSALSNYMKFNIDGFNIFVGKNNKQNDYLSLKVANDNDYWFHAKDIHGSHVILRCNGEMPKFPLIIRCAQLAAYYSKAKFSSHVPVDYVLDKYIKKPRGSAPGYVIYTNNKTVFVEPKSGIDL